MDFIVGVPKIIKGHGSVWVVVDRLTKLAQFIPTKKNVTTPDLDRLSGLPIDIVNNCNIMILTGNINVLKVRQ